MLRSRWRESLCKMIYIRIYIFPPYSQVSVAKMKVASSLLRPPFPPSPPKGRIIQRMLFSPSRKSDLNGQFLPPLIQSSSQLRAVVLQLNMRREKQAWNAFFFHFYGDVTKKWLHASFHPVMLLFFWRIMSGGEKAEYNVKIPQWQVFPHPSPLPTTATLLLLLFFFWRLVHDQISHTRFTSTPEKQHISRKLPCPSLSVLPDGIVGCQSGMYVVHHSDKVPVQYL